MGQTSACRRAQTSIRNALALDAKTENAERNERILH